MPAALLVLIVGSCACGARAARDAAGWAVAGRPLVVLALIVGAWLGTARALDRPAVNQIATGTAHPTPTLTSLNPREAGSYMWQYYLPRLPFQRRFGGLPDYPVYDIWLKRAGPRSAGSR